MSEDIYEKCTKEAINSYFTDICLRETEDFLLQTLKIRQENFPSEKHDQEWLSFTDWVLKRRGKSNE